MALLANTLATVFALFVLIEVLGPISGAHFNPLVTLVSLISLRNSPVVQVFTAQAAIIFIVSQLLGAGLANAMFDLPVQSCAVAGGSAGRMLSDSFAGIAPQRALAFMMSQCAGRYLV